MADNEDYVGVRSQYAATSETNQADYQIKQKLREVYTNFVGIIQECEGQEEQSGATYVTVTPAVQQTDGQNNAMQAAPIYKSPYGRYQCGIAAVIIDPVPGDKFLCCAPKNDSSGITSETETPQAPASLCEFNQSNSISAMPILTKTPENWIVLRQDKTRESYAPEGIKDRTDQDNEQEIGQNLIINVGNNCTITIGADESISIQGNFTGSISGNANLTVGGSLTANVGGSATLSASSITLDAPTVTCTGNMTIAGSLSQGGGGGGSATFAGTVTAQGTVTSNSDVQSNGISLTGHTHTGVHGETSGPH